MTKRRIVVTFVICAVVGVVAVYYTQQHQKQRAVDERQAYIHERGAQVMPFDLSKTLHTFTPTDTGGVQQVRANDPNDAEQVGLIRMHLNMEAGAFAAGNFDDPAMLHGEDMPGLKVLEQSAGTFEVHYSELPDGAQLTYITDDAATLDALHAWFAAQLQDHGSDAMSDMER